jgi:hypothetical protein
MDMYEIISGLHVDNFAWTFLLDGLLFSRSRSRDFPSVRIWTLFASSPHF